MSHGTCYHPVAFVLAVSHHRTEAPTAKWCPDCGAAWCPDKFKGWKKPGQVDAMEAFAVISFDDQIRQYERSLLRVFANKEGAQDSTNASLIERVLVIRQGRRS